MPWQIFGEQARIEVVAAARPETDDDADRASLEEIGRVLRAGGARAGQDEQDRRKRDQPRCREPQSHRRASRSHAFGPMQYAALCNASLPAADDCDQGPLL
jgi:hypothetical protein